MNPIRMRSIAIVGLLLAVPAVVRAEEPEKTDEPPFTWGGEIRFHGGALNSDEGFGRTGGVVESRVFLDTPLLWRFRFFAEVGSGSEQGTDDAGIERLYVEYAAPVLTDFNVKAGWIRVPFGRWDAFTLSRPLIKDRQFFGDSDTFFQLRRTSAGVGLHASDGPFETDLAVVNREPTTDLRLPEGGSRDAVGRVGLRYGGFSTGVSYLKGFGTDTVTTSSGTVDLASVSSYGIDLELSRGSFTFGGEAVVLQIDGLTSTGYYVQGAYDLSAIVRGLRLLGKYDVLREERLAAPTDSFQRFTLGVRCSLRRDLDLDVEVDRDVSSRRVNGFGGSHLIIGLRYRF